MDSLTQLALGAAVGTAALGRRTGPRRAALAGAVLGSLPDFDVFFPFGDPVDSFVLHRGVTHSLVIQAIATPVLGEALIRALRELREHRLRTYIAVYLCLSTHALLDAFTIYGTRLFWPLWDVPVGVGSVFIIDPLYTLPLLVALVWALCLWAWTPRFKKGLAAALILSTAYLGWGVAAQQMAEARADAVLAQAGVEPDRVLATPTPFNSLLWRVIAVDGDRYLNLYVPLLGGRESITAYVHPRGVAEARCLDGLGAAARVALFSKGFYRIERDGSEIRIADLRMGLTPGYVFRFVVAEEADGRVVAVPSRRAAGMRMAEGDLDWLIAGLLGRAAPRAAEAAGAVELNASALARGTAAEGPPALC